MTDDDDRDGPLHVPSPDWRDQIVYFVLTDRFANGDPGRSDQGMGEYDPQDPRKYSGGDLQGIIDRLDYIAGLGATAVWITPPVQAQWWDPMVDYGGYHGYWARNFREVDEHLGTLETYRALSQRLHKRGMYLIQDIVCNHTGNFFSYQGGYCHRDPTRHFVLNTGSIPTTRPTQPPFDRNDVRDRAQREAAIYHWTPAIEHPQDPTQRVEYALYDLDDLNTTNPTVREALKESYAYWIREVGVDAYRIDTAYHVERAFWRDFVHSANGMHAVASETGRDDFLCFGEVLMGCDAYDDTGDLIATSYQGPPHAPVLDTVLNFPLYFTLRRVFAEGRPTDELAHRLRNHMRLYRDPLRVPTFIDNHDVDRLASVGGDEAVAQALVFLLTAPGVPAIYYGTEQGFTERRKAMFAGGWGSEGRDHYDTDAPLYGLIAALSRLRLDHAVFRRGDAEPVASDAFDTGLFAFRRRSSVGDALVAFNTSDAPLSERINLAGEVDYRSAFTLGEAVGWSWVERALAVELPPRGALVLVAEPERTG